MKITLVDDHATFRELLSRALSSEQGYAVVSQAKRTSKGHVTTLDKKRLIWA